MLANSQVESNALIECKEAQIIRGKELFTDANQYEKLKSIITANVNNYNSRKASAENIIKHLRKGDILKLSE